MDTKKILHEFVLDMGISWGLESKNTVYELLKDNNLIQVQPLDEKSLKELFSLAWGEVEILKGVEKDLAPQDSTQEEDNRIRSVKVFEHVKSNLNSYWGDGTKKIAYYETGVPWIDNVHGLLKRTIISAPSNTGKTLLAIQIARSVAKLGKPVLYLDFETSPNALFTRFMITGTTYNMEDMILNGKNLAKLPEFDENKKTATKIEFLDVDEIKSIQQLHESICLWQSQHEQEGLVIIDQINALKYLLTDKDTLDRERNIAKWIRTDMRDVPWTTVILSPQSKDQANGSSINAISGSAELGYSVDCAINLAQRLKEYEPEDSGKPTKDEYWDHKSLTVHIAKTRATCVTQYHWDARINDKAEIEPLDISARMFVREHDNVVTAEEAALQL